MINYDSSSKHLILLHFDLSLTKYYFIIWVNWLKYLVVTEEFRGGSPLQSSPEDTQNDPWCNGSIPDFDSGGLGSNPDGSSDNA